MDKFAITEFCGALISCDKKGRKVNFVERKTACFIITISGKIKFSSETGIVVSDEDNAVFLPRGLNYTNECLQSAKSYVFNFNTSVNYTQPTTLVAIDKNYVSDCFEKINTLALQNSLASRLGILKTLYALAEKLFNEHSDIKNLIIDKALVFMRKNYAKPSLLLKEVAEHCAISEIYLHKLFKKHLATTPFRVLTDIRMQKAVMMIEEKRSLKEISYNVGYGDVYQFSRAYKKYFGYAPTMKGK